MNKAMLLLAVAGLSLAKKDQVTGSRFKASKAVVADDEDLWKVGISVSGGKKKADDDDLVVRIPSIHKNYPYIRHASEQEVDDLLDELWRVTVGISGGKKKADDADTDADTDNELIRFPTCPIPNKKWFLTATSQDIEALLDELWTVNIGISGGKKKKADDNDDELVAYPIRRPWLRPTIRPWLRPTIKPWLKNATEEEIMAFVGELWTVGVSFSGGKKKKADENDEDELVYGPIGGKRTMPFIPRLTKPWLTKARAASDEELEAMIDELWKVSVSVSGGKKKADDDDDELLALPFKLVNRPNMTKPWIKKFQAASDEEAEVMIDELWKATISISGGKKKADDEELRLILPSRWRGPFRNNAEDEEEEAELWKAKVTISGGKKKADDDELATIDRSKIRLC